MPTRVNARLERCWDRATTHTLVWHAAAVDRDRLAKACAEVAGSVDPRSFIGRAVTERAHESGLPVAEFLDRHGHRFVATAEHSTVEALLAAVPGRERDGLPFSFLLCPGGFALSHSHALGDGAVSARLLEAVLRTYAGDGSRVPVPTVPASDGDFVRSLGLVWSRKPRTVLQSVGGVLRRVRRRPARTVVLPEGPTAGAARVEAVTVSEADIAVLDRWRGDRENAPSLSVVLLWIVARTLAAYGYPQGPQPWQVMVSMRGAAGGLAAFGGNLVGRALVDVDPCAGTGPVSADLRRQIVSGEIVAMHLLKIAGELVASVVSWLRGSCREPVTRIGASPGLSWSDRGRRAFGQGFVDVVPGCGRTAPVVYTYVTPVQDGIGVNVNWLGDRAGLIFTFGSAPIDGTAISGVVAALNGGMSALLPDEQHAT